MRASAAVNLRQIEAFRAVVETGSVSQAADRLALSQPAVSKSVAAFEGQIGFPVFERRRGRLIPTAEALLLYDEVARVLSGIDTITQAADDIRKLRRGRVSIGVAPAMSLGFVQQIIKSFASAHEHVHVSLHTRTSIQLVNLTATRRVDLALVADYGERPGVRTLASWELDVLVLMPAEHPLAKRKTIRPEHLNDQRMIELSSMDGLQPRIDAMLQSAGAVPDYRIETPLTGSAAACVAAGLGIALVDPIIASVYTNEAIVARRFQPALPLAVCLIVPEDMTPSRLVTEMIGRVEEHFGHWLTEHEKAH